MGFSQRNKKWFALFSCLIMSVLWLLLWFAPWQALSQDRSWLKLGIALAVFIVPGLSLHGLLSARDSSWVDHITFGFVFSHLLIAFTGTMGRIFHWSFALIQNGMMFAGLILLILYIYPMLLRGPSLHLDRTTWKSIGSSWTLVLVAVFVALIVIQREFSDDDLSYLAFLTNTQYSSHLSFNDIFFGMAEPVSSRFWLMSAAFGQAFLARLSGIPGILILSGYYEPFLTVLAILCWYRLARTLRLSHSAACASVLFQALFLLLLSDYLHPGSPFFHQLSADKATATFILVPVFIQSEVELLRAIHWKNTSLFLLCGLSLTFMHPIALAYAIFIGGLLVLFDVNRENIRTRWVPLVVIAVTLLPQVILRFIGMRMEENVPYGLDVIRNLNGIENMISVWGSSQFYGFNLHILEMTFPFGSGWMEPVLKWIWLVIPLGACLYALRMFRQSEPARYILAAFLLCVVAGFPLTGWIIGYFLSAWALERAVWLFPFGLSAVFLLLSIRDQTSIGQRVHAWIKTLEAWVKIPNLALVSVAILTSLVFLLYMREHNLPDLAKFESNSRRFTDIALVGRYIDDHVQEQVYVIGSDVLNDLIPSVSSRGKVITFRTSDFFSMSLFPVEEIRQRITDRHVILSETATPETKMEMLRKYDIRFIVLTRADRELFTDLLAKYPDQMKMEKVERFFVIELGEP